MLLKGENDIQTTPAKSSSNCFLTKKRIMGRKIPQLRAKIKANLKPGLKTKIV